MPGQQFFQGCIAGSLNQMHKNHRFCVLVQRDIATADDEDHVCSILEMLMEGNGYNRG